MVEIIPEHIDTFALSTLGSKTAITVESQHSSALNSSFLMKRVRGNLLLKAADQGDVIILGMAMGDASVTEIKTALEQTQLDRDPPTQANTRVVLHETLTALVGRTTAQVDREKIDISLGGGKGIPFEKGEGWQWFAYNPDDGALQAGAEVMGQLTYYGVWLN